MTDMPNYSGKGYTEIMGVSSDDEHVSPRMLDATRRSERCKPEILVFGSADLYDHSIPFHSPQYF